MCRQGNCSDLFGIVSHIWGYYNCFQFNFKMNNYSMDILTSYRAETVSSLLYLIRLSQRGINITSQVTIEFNWNNKYNRLGYIRSLTLSELNNLIRLTYDEYTNILLPPPFSTNCRNYGSNDQGNKDEAVIDRGSCFESCMKNRTMDILGSEIIFPGVYVFEESTKKKPALEHMTVHEMLSNKSLIRIRKSLTKECDKICDRPTCEDTFYIPILKSSTEFHTPNIMIYVMQSPKIDTTVDPKLSMIGYFTNVFSTFGFWIGMSVFSFVEIGIDFLSARLKKFMEKVERNRRQETNRKFQDRVKNRDLNQSSSRKRTFSRVNRNDKNSVRKSNWILNRHANDAFRDQLITHAYEKQISLRRSRNLLSYQSQK